MRLFNAERMVQNKYNLLLVIELVICALYPIFQLFNTRFPLTTALLMLAIIFAMHVVLSKKTFKIIASVGIFAFGMNVLVSYRLIPEAHLVLTVILVLYALFFLQAIAALVMKISSRKVITSDTVKGGISIYFLISLLWANLYMLLVHLQPESFNLLKEETINYIYYSIVTITTLGYGDITPVTPYAKMLSSLEAFVGQIYIAIFVAQLVGMNIVRKMEN